MRVLKVMPGVDPGAGAEQSFAVTAPYLIQRGVKLHLVVLTRRQGLVPEFERAGGVVHDLSSCTTMWQRFRALRRVIAAVQPDVVHATLWEAVVPAQIAAWSRRVPVLVTWASVGNWARGSGVVRTRKLRAVQFIDQCLARITRSWFHAVTPGVAKVNAPVLGVPDERVRVVERGRSADVPPVDAARVDELRAEIGLPADARVVVAVGRMEPQKNHVALVAAIAAEPARSAGLHFVLAGREGLSTPAILEAIERLGCADRVHLLGHREDVRAVLAMADVFALPSLYEGAAGAAIEAMRDGVPIVSHDVLGQQGVLIDRHNALLVPVNDAEGMSAALVEVATDPDLAAKLAANAREMFLQRFTLERAVDGMEALYREIAASRS